MLPLLDSAADAIGCTPLVRLDRITACLGLDDTIVAKFEYLNPGGSNKDRVALGIIEEVERLGTIKPGQAVVELTSGNTGTGLSIVCAIKGYKFIAVMSRGNSVERARPDLALAEEKARQLEIEFGAFRADLFTRDGDWKAHFDNTGAELWQQTNGNLADFFDHVGSGGTYAGITKKLKSLNPSAKCFIIEPEGAAILAKLPVLQSEHPIHGGGYVMPDLVDLKHVPVDGYVQISVDQVSDGTRILARKEGVFAGFSSGANVSSAIELQKGDMKGKTIAIMIRDSGLMYLSTGLWSDSY